MNKSTAQPSMGAYISQIYFLGVTQRYYAPSEESVIGRKEQIKFMQEHENSSWRRVMAL